MRLYKFVYQYADTNTEIEAHYLAENDREFLEGCVTWAYSVRKVEKPEPQADPKEWLEYHAGNAEYHKFMANALDTHAFDNSVEETRAYWKSWEVSESDIVELTRLHIFEN